MRLFRRAAECTRRCSTLASWGRRQVPGLPHAALPTAHLCRELRSEAAHPAAHAPVAYLDPSLCQQFLHGAVAEGKAGVEPHSVADHLNREVEAAVEIGTGGHERIGLGTGLVGSPR